jgi:hypothetical protein
MPTFLRLFEQGSFFRAEHPSWALDCLTSFRQERDALLPGAY